MLHGGVFLLDITLADNGEEVCHPSHRYGPHVRTNLLMHAVIDGCGVLHNDFGDFPVKKGQAFFIFPKEITVYQADAHTPWHYVWTGWRGADGMLILNELGITRQNPILDLSGQAESIYRCMRRIYKDASLRHADLATVGGLLRLFALLGECGRTVSNPASAYYNRALWLMEHEQNTDPLTVDSLAHALGLSRSQLFRIFRDAVGYSPKEALTRHRCDQAIRLIQRTALSMEEIAAACCFTSGQHLCDTFRRQGLAPPSSYRK